MSKEKGGTYVGRFFFSKSVECVCLGDPVPDTSTYLNYTLNVHSLKSSPTLTLTRHYRQQHEHGVSCD